MLVLIDARHGIKPTDAPVLDELDRAAVSYQIVLTKADAVKPAARREVKEAVAKAIARRPAAFPEIVLTSSETGEGIEGPARGHRRAARGTPGRMRWHP